MDSRVALSRKEERMLKEKKERERKREGEKKGKKRKRKGREEKRRETKGKGRKGKGELTEYLTPCPKNCPGPFMFLISFNMYNNSTGKLSFPFCRKEQPILRKISNSPNVIPPGINHKYFDFKFHVPSIILLPASQEGNKKVKNGIGGEQNELSFLYNFFHVWLFLF